MAEEKDNVRVMSHEETDDYEGVTIDEGSGQPQDKPRPQQEEFFRQQDIDDLFSVHRLTWKDLLWKRRSWKQRLALIGGTVVVVGFLVFFALPALAFFVGAAAIAWLLMQLFMR